MTFLQVKMVSPRISAISLQANTSSASQSILTKSKIEKFSFTTSPIKFKEPQSTARRGTFFPIFLLKIKYIYFFLIVSFKQDRLFKLFFFF